MKVLRVTPALIALTLAGCGSTHATAPVHGKTPAAGAHAAVTGAGVPASSVAVIEGWANALRSGHLQRAAAYWALPSAMVNGLDAGGGVAVTRIRSNGDALGADATLPCGATLTSTSLSGPYIKARFTLGGRTGMPAAAGCSGVAAVDFLIGKGHIERWLRAPVSSGPAAPGGPAPGSTSV